MANGEMALSVIESQIKDAREAIKVDAGDHPGLVRAIDVLLLCQGEQLRQSRRVYAVVSVTSMAVAAAVAAMFQLPWARLF